MLRDVLASVSDDILSQVGQSIALLHENHLIHGDLTTSNMLVFEGKVFLIDFGLSEVKDSLEVKAVDLHVLKEALRAKHYKEYSHAWKLIKDSYLRSYSRAGEVFDRLKIVERRGRYKNR